jgi:hypothetical protein
MPFGDLLRFLKREYGVLLIGVQPSRAAAKNVALVNPDWDLRVSEGMVLNYIAPGPLLVDWSRAQNH